ncbi:glycosyltransferase [Octadecabacter sp. G9-8]|uniref:Glycosyltransferase n=1 Tax=Octadecabacter dasysiphoniae TaxID=2909341 RepID=A0ABS9CWK8_9RHOB|nr:glycosyltransferase [Octadecabacter dasysiphoniae]
MQPVVSVVMANYNAADYLAAALTSVLAQSVSRIEVLLADDASTDASVAIAQQVAATDARLKIIAADVNKGPAAARNRALDAATGDWIAIVDSDDIIHPQRLELMLDATKTLQTDAVADDLTYFADNVVQPGDTLLGDTRPSKPKLITTRCFLGADQNAPQLGYLKPLMRRNALRDMRYREDIRIGEDHDLYMRFLMNGGRMHLLPQSYYLYRKHVHSLSHRSHPDDVRAMIAVHDDLLDSYPDASDDLRADFAARRTALQEPLAFETLADHIKNRQFGSALRDIARKPALLIQLCTVATNRIKRQFKRHAPQHAIVPDDPSQWTSQDWAALCEPRSP